MIYLINNGAYPSAVAEPATMLQLEAYLWGKERIALDTEFKGFNPHSGKLFCIQLGDAENQFIIDMRHAEISPGLKTFLETLLIVGVNLKADLKYLYHIGIRPKHVNDLMLNEVCAWNGLYEIKETKGKYSFEALAKSYLGKEVNKTFSARFAVKEDDEPLTDAEINYSALDVALPLEILEKQHLLLEEREVLRTCKLENMFVKVLADIEYHGIRVDEQKWQDITVEVDKQLIASEQELNNYMLNDEKLGKKKIHIGKKKYPAVVEYETNNGLYRKCIINWGSPTQVLELLHNAGVHTDTTNKNELLKLKATHPLVPLLLTRTEWNALKVKFINKLLTFTDPASKKIHTDFWQVVSTGRMSSNSPNLQQMPSRGPMAKLIRGAFVTDDEHESMVTADYSNFELRIIAEGSQDPLWLKVLGEGGDLHSEIAARVFNVTLDQVAETKFNNIAIRNIAKTINFGLAYGMSAHKLSATILVELSRAEMIIKEYFRQVPEVEKYLKRLGNIARNHGVANTFPPIYRPRFFDLDRAEGNFKQLGEYERAGKNHPIQGCNADIVKLACVKLYDYLQESKFPAKIRLLVHDEIVSTCPRQLAEEWNEKKKQVMVDTAKKFLKTVPVVVDSHIDSYWKK